MTALVDNTINNTAPVDAIPAAAPLTERQHRGQATFDKIQTEPVQPTSGITARSGVVTPAGSDNGNRWPGGVVPWMYQYDDSLSPEENAQNKLIIEKGLRMISSETNITFVDADADGDGKPDDGIQNYVVFKVHDSANNSSLGMQDGGQTINIHDFSDGVVAHEMMHALGFSHAHQHPDRDNYITVNTENIDKNESAFSIRYNNTIVGEYDPDSIMQYKPTAFSNGDGETISVNDGVQLPEGVSLGQSDHLSEGDIASINKVYPATKDDILASLYGSREQLEAYLNAYQASDPNHGGINREIPLIQGELSTLNRVIAQVESMTEEELIQAMQQDPANRAEGFDAQYYLDNNPDLAEAFGNDHEAARNHWMTTGYMEGRKGSAEGLPYLSATMDNLGNNLYDLGPDSERRLDLLEHTKTLFTPEAVSDYAAANARVTEENKTDQVIINGNDYDNSFDDEGGNEVIYAGAGADNIYGGVGDDVYYLGEDEDIDTIHLQSNSEGNGNDTVHNYTNGDLIGLDSLPEGQNVYIWQDGNDTMMDYGSGTVRFTNTKPEDLRFVPTIERAELTIGDDGMLITGENTSRPMEEHANFIYTAPPEGESTAELQATELQAAALQASGEDSISDDTLIKA